MTLKSVLRALQEIFPQIDLRILRAVAIEYSKDVDAAVDFIISDVLPIISEPAEISHASYAAFDEGHSCNGNYSHGEGRNEANMFSYGDKMVEQKESSLSSEPENVKLGINLIAEHKSNTDTEPHSLDVILSQKCYNISSNIEMLDAKQDEAVKSSDVGKFLQIFEAKGYSLDVYAQELCKANVDGNVGASSGSAPIFFIQTFQENPDPMECEAAIKDSSSSIPELEERLLGLLKDVAQFPDKCNFINCVMPSTLINDERSPVAQAQCSKQLEQFTSNTGFQSDLELQEQGPLTMNVTRLCSHESESYSVSDGLQIAALATQGGDISNADFLGSVVDDAQDSKKTLVSALLSTIDMLKDVELHEENAEVARKEASIAGQDILEKVENLRQMIVQAKVKNDKDAEEIYAEQTALASETCELHSRFAVVSAETEKSLSVIEELEDKQIHQALDARLAAAKEKQAAAKNEKLEKENMVHILLREQEGVMDSIIQEAHRLQKEAEKNIKLREFLMDRDRILNIMQGEIAAAFVDVLSLKDRVQGCMPDKTLISSTTTTVVPTTSSSGKNTLFNCDPPATENSCLIDKEAKDHLLQSYALPDHKGHSDDDWEMLEDEAER